MALDLYQPCPCHQERKLKFCCGKDVVSQLSKALELLEGEQRLKAVEVLDQSIAKFGHKDCLVTMRFGSAMEADNQDAACRLCDNYQKENGNTSVGLAMKAVCHMEAGELLEAIDSIQAALETGEVPSTLLEDAILSLAIRLSLDNHFIAGRDHAALYQAISGDRQGMAEGLISRMMTLPTLPLVLKHDWPMVDPPEGQPWSKEVAQAIHWAQQGLWLKAYQVIKPLADKNPNQDSLQKNAAILAARLAKTEEAAEAWKKYAACDNVNHDHSVEAELMYLLMSKFAESDTYSESEITCEISDYDELVKGLLSDPFIAAIPGAEEEFGDEQNRPNAVFALLDRKSIPTPEEVKNPQEIPNVAAILLAFGRRTDRTPQLKLTGIKDATFEKAVDELFSRYPQLVQDTCEESIVNEMPKMFEDFDWKWRTPEQSLPDQITAWCEEHWLHLTSEVLPKYKTKLLGGKTFAEAASDSQWKRRVEAILLHLGGIHADMFDRSEGVAKARQVLNLPEAGKIDPKTIRLQDMTLHQFARLDFAKMPLDMLSWAFQAAGAVNNIPAIKAIYHDIRRRISEAPETVAQFPISTLNGILARLEPRTTKVRQLLVEADQYVGDEIDEKASWYLKAFTVAMEKRLPDLALDYFQRASQSPMSQQMQIEFAKLCSRMGISANGGERGPVGQRMPRASAIVNPGAGGNADAFAAESATEQPASKLWLPGME